MQSDYFSPKVETAPLNEADCEYFSRSATVLSCWAIFFSYFFAEFVTFVLRPCIIGSFPIEGSIHHLFFLKTAMNKFLQGISYSYNRNIGWQDRTIRITLGIATTVAAAYFAPQNFWYSVGFGVFAMAQFGTAFSARCILCYFAGQCTIGANERQKLDTKGIMYERARN